MERHFGNVAEAAVEVPAALWPYFLFPPDGQMYVPPRGDADGPAVPVRVNHGVWQTCCPFCPSAQHASISDRRFFCAVCLNTEAGNCTLPVLWPDDKTLLAIDSALSARPFVTTQNWEPGETVAQLLAENGGLRADAELPALVSVAEAIPETAPSVVFDSAAPDGA